MKHLFIRHTLSSKIWPVLLMLIFAVPQWIFADQYYVASNGSDQNPGSEQQPWRSLSKANVTLRAGDEVLVRAGIYTEQICPVNDGNESAPIIFRAFPGEKVVLKGPGETATEAVVAIGYPGKDASWRGSEYIIVDGFEIDPTFASYGVAVYGSRTRHNTIRNCHLVCNTPTDPRNHGVLIGSAQHTHIENNVFTGDWHAGIITTSSPKYTIIRNNTIEGILGNCIDIQTSVGENQAMLIEKNRLIGARREDGIQFEPNYSLSFDHGSFRGVIIRNNIIANNAENAIDLKGSAHVVIEGNIIYGNRGDNDGKGNVSGGTGGIMKGDISKTQAHNILIRRNFIYDNKGGISMHNHRWVVVNNTIIGNNRTYKGPNCSLDDIAAESSSFLKRYPGLAGVRLTEEYAPSFDFCVIKNNIIGGNHQGELAVLRQKDLSKVEIDGNLYYNAGGVTIGDVEKAWSWTSVSHASIQSRFSSGNSPIGGEQHSTVLTESPLNMSSDAPVGSGNFDYSLRSQSPAIDAGLPLATTTRAGSGTVMPVSNARCFSSGYEIVPGDTIVLHASGERAQIIDIDTEANTLTLNRTITWGVNEGVSTLFNGSAPDIGAVEASDTAPAPPPISPLQGSMATDQEMGTAPLAVQFSSAISGGEAPYQYAWDFGDGSLSDEEAPRHIYANTGQWSATLKVTDAGGRTLVKTQVIQILEPMKVYIRNASLSKTMLVPTTSNFSSEVTGGLQPFSYTWFVNGQHAGETAQLSHTFTQGGLNRLILEVHDQIGNSTRDTLDFEGLLPLRMETEGQLSTGPLPAQWKMHARVEGGKSPYNIQWIWAGQIHAEADTVTRHLNASGLFQSICQVDDASGQRLRDTLYTRIAEGLSAHIDSEEDEVELGLPVVFQSHVNGGIAPYTLDWTLGDGYTANGAQVTYTYTSSGVYNIVLTVTDSQGQQCEVTSTLRVKEPESLATVQQVALKDPSTGATVQRLVSEQWVALELKVVPQTTWDDVGFIDCILRRGDIDQSLIDERGGSYSASENYVFSLSIKDQTLWAKQSEGSDDWQNITGNQGDYLDGRSSGYRIDKSTGIIKVRLMLHPAAQYGEWVLTAVAYDANRIAAMPLTSKLFVQDQAHTPHAKIYIDHQSLNEVQVRLESNLKLADPPQTLTFIDHKGSAHQIVLNGSTPGNTFRGSLRIDDKIVDGQGQFVLSNWALRDVNGNIGHQIILGAIFNIDKTPPAQPQNVEIIE